MPKLKATERDVKIKLAGIRKEGFVPAVYYGKKEKSIPVSVNAKDFKKIWKEVGETTTFELETPKGIVDAMIYYVQLDPIKNEPLHIDFYVVEKGQKVEVEVPLEFVGVSPAVKDLNGILVKVLHEITVEGEPKNIPHEIEIDISVLKTMDDQILAKDIVLPKGVELVIEPEEVVAAISEAEAEEAETPAMDISAIEVEKKGKKEEAEA